MSRVLKLSKILGIQQEHLFLIRYRKSQPARESLSNPLCSMIWFIIVVAISSAFSWSFRPIPARLIPSPCVIQLTPKEFGSQSCSSEYSLALPMYDSSDREKVALQCWHLNVASLRTCNTTLWYAQTNVFMYDGGVRFKPMQTRSH